ncbi:hypothetical protein CTEN210_04053 [Chaetoceros tenuissimus]|uniref:Uncharacterized protein n=1 Tax=Chaetoceros tenuissimus TaxID=426638 RepID=A0AAD3CL53_9STRA|nr:hypothetical protein CTEN210_04053 [Chaetoceros tenuissimus]
MEDMEANSSEHGFQSVASREELLSKFKFQATPEAPHVSFVVLTASWINQRHLSLEAFLQPFQSLIRRLMNEDREFSYGQYLFQVDASEESIDFCVKELSCPDELPAIYLMYYEHDGRLQHVKVDLEAKDILSFDKNSPKLSLWESKLNQAFDTFDLDQDMNVSMEQEGFSSNTHKRSFESEDQSQVRIFIAGDKSQVGKSSICMGILGALLKKGYDPRKLAYIKPATQCEETQLVKKYCEAKGIEAVDVGPVVYYKGFTRAFLNGETESSTELLEKVKNSVDTLSRGKQVVLVDGVGYPAVGSITNTDNASVSLASGCHGVLIVGKRGVGDAVDSYNLNATYFRSRNIPVLGAIFNKLPLDGFYSLEKCRAAVSKYFEQNLSGVKKETIFGFVPEMKDMSDMDSFINSFNQYVDVQGILNCAAILLDNGGKSMNGDGMDEDMGRSSIKAITSSTKRIRLSRDQIEQSAKASGAADVSLVRASIAFQCINARGAIAHGRVIETTYVPLDDDSSGKGAENIFNDYGGYLSFTTAEQIKNELMSRGPVVSVFFKLYSSFLKSDVSRCQTFNFNLQNELHDILIVGWEQTPTGECWIIYPFVAGYAENDYYGMFGVDDLCIAPKNDFMEWNWQIGPYFRCNLDAANPMWIQ